MKSNRFSSTLSIVFFLLTLALALFSWIGSIYGLGEVQSLLSAEGIRWVLGHVVENYVQSPILGMVYNEKILCYTIKEYTILV